MVLYTVNYWDLSPSTRSEKKCISSFIDDHTRHNRIYLLASKDQTPSCLFHYKTPVEKQTSRCIGRLKPDRSGEYSSTEFLASCIYCTERGYRNRTRFCNPTDGKHGLGDLGCVTGTHRAAMELKWTSRISALDVHDCFTPESEFCWGETFVKAFQTAFHPDASKEVFSSLIVNCY